MAEPLSPGRPMTAASPLGGRTSSGRGWSQQPLRWIGQAVLYAAFALLVGVFSSWPPFRLLADDEGLLRLSLLHPGKPKGDCRTRSAEELARMPPQMRAPLDCPRERSPVTIELRLDDRLVTRDVIQAPGLYNDQGIDVYRNFKVSAGKHRLSIWMNDDVNVEGPTYQHEQAVSLQPAQRLVIAFNSERDGFSAN